MEEAFQLLCESWDAGMLVNTAFAKAAYPFALERFLGWQQNRLRDEMLCETWRRRTVNGLCSTIMEVGLLLLIHRCNRVRQVFTKQRVFGRSP